MQQFADYDNEGYDIKTCLFDIVQNSKMSFYQCKEVWLFGLKFTESPSASNWTEHSVNNREGIVLPQTFEELEQIPLNHKYNFLMSLNKESIDKEVVRIGVEAHMFWELPKVRDALNDLRKKWFYNDNKAYIKTTIDISEDSPTTVEANTTIASPSIAIDSSQKKKRQCIELGVVEKLVELWRLRKRILEHKQKSLSQVFSPDTIMRQAK